MTMGQYITNQPNVVNSIEPGGFSAADLDAGRIGRVRTASGISIFAGKLLLEALRNGGELLADMPNAPTNTIWRKAAELYFAAKGKPVAIR
jgi:hypothetical protein